MTQLTQGNGAPPGARGQVAQQLRRVQRIGGNGGRHGRGEERAGERDASHLLQHHAHFEQADTAAAVLFWHQQTSPSEVDQRGPQRRRDAIGVLGQLTHHVRPALALQRTAGHVLQCELLVVVCEVHGLPYVSLTTCHSLTLASEYTVVRVLFPCGFCPCTRGREVPRRVAGLARRTLGPLLAGRRAGGRCQSLG